MPIYPSNLPTHPSLLLFSLPCPPVLPRVEGGCSDKGVRLQLHYGNMDTQWEVYVGGRRLDWELVEMGDYALETRQDYFSMVIPLYGLGMAYEVWGLNQFSCWVLFVLGGNVHFCSGYNSRIKVALYPYLAFIS